MSTPFKVTFKTPIDRFIRRIEEDKDFFEYNGITSEQSLAIARERAKHILFDAVNLMDLISSSKITFSDYDEILEEFNTEWTSLELFIVVGLMYQLYLDKDIPKLKLMSVNYTSTDLRVLDPSNARKTFMEMYQFVCNQNEKLIDEYRNQDRLTGKYISVNYPSYDE